MIITTILGLVTGIGTTIFDGIMQYKKHKQDQQFQLENKKLELAKMDKEYEYMIKEAEMNMKTMETQTEGDIKIAEMDAFTEGQKNLREQTEPLADPNKILTRLLSTKGSMKYAAFPIAYFLALLFGVADVLKYIRRSAIFYYVMVLVGILLFPIIFSPTLSLTVTNAVVALLPDIIHTILYLFEAITLSLVGITANRKVFKKK